DTIMGATFVALAPEHPLVEQLIQSGGPQAAALRGYVERASGRLELERQQGEPDGVFTGLMAVNPANGAHVPIWVADYVLASYGTGAIMGVPAHDERDARFAEKYGLAVADERPKTKDEGDRPSVVRLSSSVFRPVVRYRMRDWLSSTQRYLAP